MRILESFIDCVYEKHLYQQDLSAIRTKLINRLPDKRICMLANILMIKTKYDMYAVEVRMCDTKSDGSIDVEKIHQRIMESDFIEISKEDYANQIDGKTEINIDDWRNIKNRTDELIYPCKNVIFKMDELDVDTLI